MGLPSATMETQVVSSARISKVKVAGGLGDAGTVLGAGFGAGDGVGLDDGGVAEPSRIGAGFGEAGSAEMGPDESVPEDRVPAGDGFPTVSELVEVEGEVAGGAETGLGAGAGLGPGAEDGCGEFDAAAWDAG
jgi:hypothetical protein